MSAESTFDALETPQEGDLAVLRQSFTDAVIRALVDAAFNRDDFPILVDEAMRVGVMRQLPLGDLANAIGYERMKVGKAALMQRRMRDATNSSLALQLINETKRKRGRPMGT